MTALQANDGDCLLLHYARSDAPTLRILVDGGSRGIYRQVLRRRIDQLRHGGSLDLRMALVSHIDLDHITGILDLFRDMERVQDDGGEPFCRVRTLWHNAFEKVHAGRRATVQSAAVGAALGGAVPAGLNGQGCGRRRERPVRAPNSATSPSAWASSATRARWRISVRAPEGGLRVITVAPGLTSTILGPHDEQLQELDEEWRRSEQTHPANPDGAGRRLPQPDGAEPVEHRIAARSRTRPTARRRCACS